MISAVLSEVSLALPAGDGCGRIAADNAPLAELLAELAERLSLPYPEPCSPPPDVRLTDRAETALLPAAGKSAYLRRDPASGQFVFVIRRKNNFSDDMKMMLFWQIVHAALLPLVQQGRALLMHGAILFHPELRRTMVLFGESGVGKTTAAGRFRAAGGESPADDRMLLTFSGKDVFAQPLPTWSRFAKRERCDFARRYPVDGMALLFRGKDDRIAPADPGNWLSPSPKALPMRSCIPPTGFRRNSGGFTWSPPWRRLTASGKNSACWRSPGTFTVTFISISRSFGNETQTWMTRMMSIFT